MKYNLSAIRDSERLAMSLLSAPFMACNKGDEGAQAGAYWANMYPSYSYLLSPNMLGWYKPNQFMSASRLTTMPGELQQELPYTAQNNFEFIFASADAPPASATLANIKFAENNVAAVYGIRLRIGYGANTMTRRYQTFGNTLSDDFIYQSTSQLVVESENQMTNLNTNDFRQVPDGSPLAADKYDGMLLINPIRLFSGKLGILSFNIKCLSNPVNLVNVTPNTFLQCTWMIAYGQASGGPAPAL
jgi:hypothetical protein